MVSTQHVILLYAEECALELYNLCLKLDLCSHYPALVSAAQGGSVMHTVTACESFAQLFVSTIILG
jgi:hypothetical protein